jgi:translocator protein
MKNKILGIITAIMACELVGAIGSLFTAPSIGTWYALLQKPSFNPPNWIFAPVWTTLFALMGIAVFMIWEKRNDRRAKNALLVFTFQMVLNVMWSILFFGGHSPLAGFIDIIILWMVIVWTIAVFRKVSPWSAWLLVPYLAWVSFAAYLNYSLMILN